MPGTKFLIYYYYFTCLLSLTTSVVTAAFVTPPSSSTSSWTRTSFHFPSFPKRTAISFELGGKKTTKNQPPTWLYQPPWYLNNLAIGESIHIRNNTNNDNDDDGTNHQSMLIVITKVSNDPPIFHIPNFITPTHCQTIMKMAETLLQEAQTRQGIVSHRTGSQVAWLGDMDDDNENTIYQDNTNHHHDCFCGGGGGYSDDKPKVVVKKEESSSLLPGYLQHWTAQLFLPHAPSVDVERLQVVRYEPLGKYDLHHDGFDRTVTVLTYLNGIAGTWFPFVTLNHTKNDDNFNNEQPNATIIPTMQLGNENMVKGRIPGRDGICFVGNENTNAVPAELLVWGENNPHVIRVDAGDAICFYNYQLYHPQDNPQQLRQQQQQQLGEENIVMAWKALHCGLPTPTTKWIATNWLTAVVEDDCLDDKKYYQ